MKKLYVPVMALTAIVFLSVSFFTSCQKESSSNAPVATPASLDASEMREYLISEYQFSNSSIQETDSSFIVEDDVVFSKKDFWAQYKHNANPNAKHYWSLNKVTAVTTIEVNIEAVPTAWKTAFASAITKWNDLNGKVKFKQVTNYCPAYGITLLHVSFTKLYGSVLNESFAQGDFPSTNGYPGSFLRVNSTCPTTLTAAQKLKTAVHELGHTIGLMHTDDIKGYSQLVLSTTSCNTGTDPNSIMRQGAMNFTDFSACDKAAFKYLYPR